MTPEAINGIVTNLVNVVTEFGLKFIGALIFWVLGRWLINIAVKLISRALKGQSIDSTIIKYFTSALGVVLQNVLSSPAPDVEILEFNLAGPVLAVRPYCNNDHYWQVYFDTNRLIREAFGDAGYPVPEQHYSIRQ